MALISGSLCTETVKSQAVLKVIQHTCYVDAVLLLEDLLEEGNLELHVRSVQPGEIHVNISHEVWEFPVLSESQQESVSLICFASFISNKTPWADFL